MSETSSPVSVPTLEAAAAPESGSQGVTRVELVDCDVHPSLRSMDELRAHLPGRWKDADANLVISTSLNTCVYAPIGAGIRLDAIHDGAPAASDPDFTFQQLFVEHGVDVGMLIPLPRPHLNPEDETVVSNAYNRWLDETWLTAYNAHGRYRGAICVCASDPAGAAREIEHWAGHPTFAQIRVNAYAGRPFGDPFYDPTYAAAERHGYPIAVHFSKGISSTLLSPVGYSSYYFEHHALFYPLTYGAHLVSLICNGTFDRFPGLKVVLIEGGFGWAAPLVWRLEHAWDAHADSLPAKRRPVDYFRENIRFTSQPIEEPARRDMLKLLDLAEADTMLMFSSDYPHWDFDDPKHILKLFPAPTRARIAAGNAIELYRLPEFLPAKSPGAGSGPGS